MNRFQLVGMIAIIVLMVYLILMLQEQAVAYNMMADAIDKNGCDAYLKSVIMNWGSTKLNFSLVNGS